MNVGRSATAAANGQPSREMRFRPRGEGDRFLTLHVNSREVVAVLIATDC
jgi:hypothetical protein